MAGQPSTPETPKIINVIRLGVPRDAIRSIQVVDLDMVVQLKSGKKLVLREAAVRTMMDPDFKLELLDGEILGAQVLKSMGPLQIESASRVFSPAELQKAASSINLPAVDVPTEPTALAAPVVDAAKTQAAAEPSIEAQSLQSDASDKASDKASTDGKATETLAKGPLSEPALKAPSMLIHFEN